MCERPNETRLAVLFCVLIIVLVVEIERFVLPPFGALERWRRSRIINSQAWEGARPRAPQWIPLPRSLEMGWQSCDDGSDSCRGRRLTTDRVEATKRSLPLRANSSAGQDHFEDDDENDYEQALLAPSSCLLPLTASARQISAEGPPGSSVAA